MKPFRKKLMASALAACLLLTGCGGATVNDPGKTGAKGRYVEEKLDMPEKLFSMQSLTHDDDGFTLVGLRILEGWKVELAEWSSPDGKNWQDTGADFSSLSETTQDFTAATRIGKNEYYVVYSPEPEEGANEDEEEYGYNYQLGHLKDGLFEILPADIENPETLLQLGNGDLVATYYVGDILRVFNGKDGSKKYGIQSEDRLWQGFYAVVGNTLAISDSLGLRLFGLDTGLPQQTLDLENGASSGVSAIFPADESGEGWYYANSSGIYKTQNAGALTERFVDGDLTSLSLPTLEIRQLFVEDGTFYVLLVDEEDDYHFYRYYYDENTPTTPDTTLRVYSLEDNPTIRLAANTFQRLNPSVQVKYEYGYTEGGAQTLEDALKALATQLLADGGPDVIIMDGLPLKSYIDRGILADLSALADESLRAEMYENLALSNTTDGKLYTIAARFTMPMLFAEEQDKEVFESPKTLADYLTEQEVPLFGRDAEHFIEALFPLYSTRWLADDYSLHTKTLQEDLTQLKRLTDLYEGYEVSDDEGDMFGGPLLTGTLYPVFLAELRATSELKGAYTNRINGMEHQLFALPSEDAPYFTPHVNLSVADSSNNKELAMDFIRCVLSEEVQAYELEDGLPVNRTAMQKNQRNTSKYQYKDENGTMSGSYGWSYYNPFTGAEDTSIVTMYWPDEAFFERYALWENATTPLWEDRTVLDILVSDCTPYLLGQKGLDECIQSLEQRLNLLAAENA